MKKKFFNKILAVLLVLALTNTNFIPLATFLGESYAASINYEKQNTEVSKTAINFDAYFVNENNEKMHTYVSEMENNELKIFIDIALDKGYLKNGAINIKNSNFKLVNSEEKSEYIENIDVENNKVTLKQISKDKKITIEIPIEINKEEKFELSNFSKDTEINLTGTFVNDSAKEIEVNKNIIVNLALSENANSYLTGKVINNAIFEENGISKRLVQVEIDSKVENNALPIKTTEIEMKIPTISGKSPEHISVIANSTEATNGDNGDLFKDYKINDEKIEIKVENSSDEKNCVSWKRNSMDKYIVNLVYLLTENDDKINLELNSKLSLYNNEEKIIENKFNEELQLINTDNSIINSIIENPKEISKGYMLVKDAPNTEYTEKAEINIGYSPITNYIEISKNSENYIDENEKEYSAKTFYKEISIKKENFEKILGKDGKIDIIENEKNIGIITINNLTYKFENEISDIKLKTSKPITEGILRINTTKYIKSTEYSKDITNSLKIMTTKTKIKTNNSEEEINQSIDLKAPTYQISSEINPNTLSTVKKNENVEIRITLKNNNSTQKLYKDPTVEIEIPSYIKEIESNSINLFYDDEIVPKSAEVKTNEKGNKTLILKMQGEQTKFKQNESYEGLTLVANVNLTTDKATPNITQKMKIKVITNNEEIEIENDVKYSTPIGMVALNSMENYNNKEEISTSVSGEQETGKLDKTSSSKIATETIKIINNYGYACGDVKILGRTPSKGNKDMITGEEIGSTFTAEMVSKIKAVEGIKDGDFTVYYSTNSEATEDLENENNGWKQEVENLREVKSYLIILGVNMEKGDVISFKYDVEIPEGLKEEESTYSMFKTFYTNLDGVVQGQREEVVSPKVGASTQNSNSLKVTLQADVKDEAEVKEGKIIKYTTHITNTSNETIKDVTLTVDIPKILYYAEEVYYNDTESYGFEVNYETRKYEETIKEIKANETIEKTFYLKVATKPNYTLEDLLNTNNEKVNIDDYIKREDFESDEQYEYVKAEIQKILDAQQENNSISEAEKEQIKKQYEELTATEFSISANISAKIEDEIEKYTSNSIKNKRITGNIELSLSTNENLIKIETGETIIYYLNIEKINNNTIYNNLEINCEIPEGITFVDSNYDDSVTMSKNKNKISWKMDKLTESKIITLSCKIDQLTTDVKNVKVKMTGKCDEINGNVESNEVSILMGKAELKTTHTSNNKIGSLYEEDEIEYIYTIENVSNVNAYDINIKDYTSTGLAINEISYKVGDNEPITGTTNEFSLTLPPNEKAEVVVKGNAGYVDEDKTSIQIFHYFEMTYDNETVTSNKIEHTINKLEYDIDDNNVPVEKYVISGLAWLDINSDGVRDNSETLLKGIRTVLINEVGNVVSTVYTGENGEYIFTGITKGKYIVAFVYDKMNYDITKYDANQANTSKVLDMNIKIDGIETECAATNTIELSGNTYNINIGLVENKKFDLSLTKTISKITTKTASGTTSKEYNNSKLEKIEIKTKELKGATVAIEYTITVTNNGALPGYANRIVDYLSSTDLKFNSELNSDWYLGTDGELYNSTLNNRIINPGESASLKLVLTKNVSETNTGLTNNTAEIYEAYNDSGVKDINSTPGNKIQNENDYGMAEIIIGIKTGVVSYLAFTIILIIAMVIAIFIIKKKIIDV